MRELAAEHSGDSASDTLRILLGLDALQQAGSLLLFCPLHGEPDPLPLMTELPRQTFVFPRIDGSHLGLFIHTPGCIWVPGPFGLKEPDPLTWERTGPETLDLAILPGLAFDARGGRLGRGKGYYDRLLGHPDFQGVKVGLCWDWQLVGDVPEEAHDIRMDLVVAGGKLHDPASLLDNPVERG